MKDDKHRKTLFLLGLLLCIIKVLYIYIVDTQLDDYWHGWTWYKHIDYSKIIYELPFFITALLIYLKGYRNNGISFFMTIFFCMAFIPANGGLSINNNDISFYFLQNVYQLLLMYLLSRFSKKIGDEDFAYDPLANSRSEKIITIFRVVMLISVAAILYRVYLYNGLDLSSIVGRQMYDVRAEGGDFYAEHEGSFYAYLYIFTSGFLQWFVPLFLYYALVNKRIIDILIVFLCYFAEFSSSMMKGTLFSILVVLYFVFLRKIKKE